jgi:hypothetical protein
MAMVAHARGCQKDGGVSFRGAAVKRRPLWCWFTPPRCVKRKGRFSSKCGGNLRSAAKGLQVPVDVAAGQTPAAIARQTNYRPIPEAKM